MEMIISRQHKVQLSEVGPAGRLGPVVLMYFLQNIANEHAGALGFGFEDLTARQMAGARRSRTCGGYAMQHTGLFPNHPGLSGIQNTA